MKVTTDISLTNVSAQYALTTLLTCLESSLGVFNACLPVSRPVFDKLKPASFINADQLADGVSAKKKHAPKFARVGHQLARCGMVATLVALIGVLVVGTRQS